MRTVDHHSFRHARPPRCEAVARRAWYAVAATLLFGAAGCPPMAITMGAKTAASIIADDRSLGQQISDLDLKGQIERALIDESSALAERVNVDVFIGRVMLTGLVPDEAARSTAARIARRIAGDAYDDIEIGPSSLTGTAEEAATNETLGVNLLAGEGLASQSLLHRVVNRTAFIMGEVREQSQIDTVRSVAEQTPGVGRVVTHIVLEQ
jgi:osmotically-inducible protein OsmY